METVDYRWRDRILLLVCWGTIFFTAVANWASDGYPLDAFASLDQTSWQAIESAVYTMLPIVLILVPIVLWALPNLVPSFTFSKIVNPFQRQEVFWGLVFAFNLGQAALISQQFRNSLLIEFLLISLMVVILVWLFYRRDSFDITKMILCASLWTMNIITRQTLLFLQPKIDFFNAAWYTKAYILLMVFILTGLVVLPLIVLFDRGSRFKTKVKDLFERIPVRLWALIFILASLWTFAFFWTMEKELVGILAMRLGYVGIAFSISLMLIWVFGSERRRDASDVLTLGKNWYVLLIGLLLLIYVFLAFRVGANNLENINPDGLSYLNIAREYARGNAVVRGYWAPLLSWLIAPWISLGASPHAVYLTLVGVTGFFWILGSIIFARRMGISRVGRVFIAVGLIIVTLSFGFSVTTPDLLGAVFILFYFYLILHQGYEDRPIKYGILVGLMGALAYYSKYYNLPFVLAHLALTAGLRFLHKKRAHSIVLSTTISVIILGCCMAPWIISLYNRYGEFTISTSGAIAHAIVGPEMKSHVCWQDQLCDQPEDVLIPWEDPQPQYYASYGWSPLDSLEYFRHQIRILKINLLEWTTDILFRFGPLLPLGLIGVGFSTFIFWRDIERRFYYSWASLTILLYAGGYMMSIASQLRYFLPILPLLFMVSYSLLQAIVERASTKISESRLPQFSFMVVVGLLISVLSLGHFDLIKFRLTNQHDPCLKNGSEAIAPALVGPIAGTDYRVNYVAYYTSTKTYGVINEGMTAEEVDAQLHEFGVKTVLIPETSDLATQLTDFYQYAVLLRSQLCGDELLILKIPE